MSPEEHAAWDRIGQLSRKGFEDQEGIFAIIDLSLGGPANGVMNPADVNIYYGAEAANFLQGYAFRKALGTLFGNGNGHGAQNIIDPRGERVNRILVRDFPEDGYFIEGEYAYDLSAFNQFYTDYGEKFVTDRIKRKDGNVIKLN